MSFCGEILVASYCTVAVLVSKLTRALCTPGCLRSMAWMLTAHAAQSMLGILTCKTATFVRTTADGTQQALPFGGPARSSAEERLGNAAAATTKAVANHSTTLLHLATGSVAQAESSSQAAFGLRYVRYQASASKAKVTPRNTGRHFSNTADAAKPPAPNATATNGPMQHSDAVMAARMLPPKVAFRRAFDLSINNLSFRSMAQSTAST